MNRQPVVSSNITSIGYDADTCTLEVEFGKDEPDDPTNRIYRYRDVPVEIHAGLMSHPSRGRYLYRNIAYKFPYELIGTRGELEGDPGMD